MPVRRTTTPLLPRAERDITSLYLEDFAAQWDRLLADIAIAPFAPSVRRLSPHVLSAPDSPLRALWSAPPEGNLALARTRQPAPPTRHDLCPGSGARAQTAAKAADEERPEGVPTLRALAEQQLAFVFSPHRARGSTMWPVLSRQTVQVCTELFSGRTRRRNDRTAPWLISPYLAIIPVQACRLARGGWNDKSS